MAKAQAQTTTGRTRIKNGLSVTLYGAAGKGKEGTFGSAGPVGTGLEPGVVIAIPSGQTANALQLEQPEGTILGGIDASGGFLLSGNTVSSLRCSKTTISAAAIAGTGTGQLGHANGVILAPAPGTGFVLQWLATIMSYTFATAAYTGGGNITVNIGAGGAALSGVIAYGSSLGAGSSNIIQFVPLSTAGFAMTTNAPINLVAASAPTQPGTAAGTVKVYTYYAVHPL